MGSELAPCPECGEVHPEAVLKCPTTDVVQDLSGRILDEKFRLLARLGSGGMADVWLATNLHVDKNVAIKLIRPDFIKNEETLSRFRNEARAAGRIGNPHICDILDLGQSPIGPYIVMELLVGQSLADLITQESRLEAPIAAAIARQALNGLAAAHDAGIVHRDLKPENIFLHRPEGGRSVVKLMDFGVSKFTDGTSGTETAQGVLLGTPQFMSPEQVRGAKGVDERADVWAMGAILYRALTGTDAFLGPTMAASLLNVAKEDPKPITDIVPDVPPGLVEVVNKCLSRDITRRYQTAREVSEALEPWAAIGPLPETATSGAALLGAGSGKPTVVGSTEQTTAVFNRDERDLPTGEESGGGLPRWIPAAAIVALLAGVGAFLTVGNTPDPDPDPDPTTATAAAAVPVPVPDQPTTAPPPDPLDDATAVPPEDPVLEVDPEPEPEPGPPDPVADSAADTSPAPAPRPTGGSGGAASADGPPPEVPGTIRADQWVTPRAAPDAMDHRAAKDHCKALADQNHLGVSSWGLANPAQAGRFASARGLKRGKWWTSARPPGDEAKTIVLPGGRRGSAKIDRKHRPLCVARVI